MSTFEIGLLNNSYNTADALGVAYPSDKYSFTLGDTQSLKLSLTGISTTVDWQFKNSDGTTLHSGSVSPTNSQGINIDNLSAGEYALELTQTSSDTNYALNIDPLTRLNVESGFFTVGETGQVGVDYLIDGGAYQGELAIFSLTGIETFSPGSSAFIKEAARRALSNSIEGYIAIKDATEGAKFSPTFPWGDNQNSGEYKNVKSFTMKPGDKFGFMLVPNGSVQEVFDNPSVGGAKRPLFSLVTANPNEAFHLGQIADVTGDGKTFVMEDKRVDAGTDKDYNDLVFRVTGATGKAVKLDEVISSDKDWRNTQTGEDLRNYINTPPQYLQFSINPVYKIGDPVSLTGAKVFDENGDLDKVDFLVRKDEGDWNLINSISNFTVNDDWAGFNYSWTPSAPGNYQLKAIATDKLGQKSNEVVQSFQVNPANIAPTNLQLSLPKTSYFSGETVSLIDGKVYDENGNSDLKKIDIWLQKDNENWQNISNSITFTADSGDNRWSNFNYSLNSLTVGNYQLKAIASDRSDASSNPVIQSFTVANKPVEPPPNSAPQSLQFNILPSYTIGQTISIADAKVYDLNGSTDLKKVDFWLQKEGSSWQKVSDTAIFTPDSGDNNWGAFNYSLSGIESGNYQLKAIAYDRSDAVSNEVIKNFSILNKPAEPVPNSAPQFLQFSIAPFYTEDQPINITSGKVYDENGAIDLTKVSFKLQKDSGNWVEYYSNIFTPDSQDNRWANFNFSWSGLAPGYYQMEALAYDKANAESNKVVQNFTVEANKPPQPNRAPGALDFSILPLYVNGETLSFSDGKVYDPDGARDVDKVYFWLGTTTGEEADVIEVSQFTPDRKGNARFDFNYDLSKLAPGRYQLWAIATDKSGDYSEPTIQTFSITTDAGIKGLSDEERLAMLDAAKLENYTPEQLAATREWVVWITPGQSSAELATAVEAQDKGATGYIPNTYIWEFPDTIAPEEVIQRLNSLPGLELSYPLVPVPTTLSSTPNDEPLVQKPGTLNPSYPVPDPNDTKLRDFLNSYQWHLRSGVNQSADANISNAWNLAQGKGVVIGIVDDGLDFNNLDLKDRYRGDLSWDFNENNSTPSPTYNKSISLKNTPKFIRDYGQTNIYLDVPLTGVLSDVNVRLNATHAKLSDLEISLDSPNEPIFNPTIGMASSSFRRIQGGNGSGKNPVKLFDNFIGNGANLTNTIFDDQASLSIFQGTAPFTGKFRPLGTLSDFNDQWAGGTWNLRITDKAWVAAGLLSNWTLDLQTYNPHGTAVAGIAAATGNNSINGSGVAPLASLAGLRLVADAVTDEQIAMALTHKNQDIDIYNNSWKLQDRLIKPALTMAAMKEGTNLGRRGLGNNYVFGAGNDEWTGGNVNYNGLANSRYAIAVAAIDHTGEQTIYSEPGAPLLVSAYSSGGGVGITTTDLMGNSGYSTGDYTNRFGGTSAAAPLVSGVIALMLEANPNLSWRDVQHILVRTAKQNDPTDLDWTTNGAGYHINHKYGFGAIDADAAVRLAKNWISAGDEVTISSDLQNVLENIPDGDEQTGVTSTISINDDISVEKVEVLFDANHNDWSDLKLVLTSPDGTQSVLADYISSDSNVSPSNKLTPLSSIWNFTSARHWGESSKGEWKLQAFDCEGNQIEGKWNSWKLNIYGNKTTVTVNATDANATESGNPGEFTITRTGDTKDDLTVYYSVQGNANNGADYNLLPNKVVIPKGQFAITVPITPIEDTLFEGNENVVINLIPNNGYIVGNKNIDTVTIADNDVPFTKLATSFKGGVRSSSSWGDYDNDSDLDILSSGLFTFAQIYRNDNSNFVTSEMPIGTNIASDSAWGDYDNDNNLDLVITNNFEGKIYHNSGGSFTDIGASVMAISNSDDRGSVAWGDYDNDGDLDLLMTGDSQNGRSVRIYRNNGNNTFTDVAASLIGVEGSSAAWGDYDNDGDLDILLTGWGGSSSVTKIYRNDGSSGGIGWNFTDINAPLRGVHYGSVAWGDYDSDGYLDIIITGLNSFRSNIYHNDGNGNFTDIMASLPKLGDSSVAWGDYDNDGDLDILLTGYDAASGNPSIKISKVYRNDGFSTFTEINSPMTGISYGSVAWGDYDKDGDLDALLNGAAVGKPSASAILEIYQNNIQKPNLAPVAPTGLNTSVNGNSATLKWNPATDAETAQKGLTYNLRVGTTPGGYNIMSPMAASNGERKVAQMGNVNLNTSWTLKNLKPGTYYWSVQAIDNAFVGSQFATEGTFTVV